MIGYNPPEGVRMLKVIGLLLLFGVACVAVCVFLWMVWWVLMELGKFAGRFPEGSFTRKLILLIGGLGILLFWLLVGGQPSSD